MGAAIVLLALTAVVVIGSAPVAWWLLGLCAIVVFAVLVVALAEGRYFEPLTLVAAFAALAFVVRPLYLFLYSTQLISFTGSPGISPVKSLLRVDNSEISLFATTKLHGLLQPALTRAVGACAVFLLVFVAVYLAGIGKRLGRRLARAGAGVANVDLRAAVALSLMVGLIGQGVILAKSGGVTEAANSQVHQTALQAGLVEYVLAGFGVVGVVVWAAWRAPRTRLERAGFAIATLEVCLFYVLVGSRTHVLAVVLTLVVVVHYRWRRLRLREVALSFLAGLVLAAALLGIRQATTTEKFTRALSSAPAYIEDPRGLINDITQFDQLFYATSSIGVTLHYKHGGWLLAAVTSYIPRFIDPGKPQPPDITFRREIFGSTVGAGRPPTVVGDLYYDFGFAGIAVGAAIVALAARLMLSLPSDPERPGYPYRIALYGLLLFVLYELVSNDVAIAIGYVLTLVVPLLVTVFIFGRIRVGSRPRLAGAT